MKRLGLLAVAAACGGPPAESAPIVVAAASPEALASADLPASDWIVATATGPDAAQAEQRALDALANDLWALGRETPAVAPPAVFDPESDVRRTAVLDSGEHAVLLAANRKTLATRVEAWLANAPSTPVTDASRPDGQLAAARAFLDYLRMQAFGCRLLRELVASDCEPPALDVAVRQLGLIAGRLRLESRYDGGVPYRTGDGALRQVAVAARWESGEGEPIGWAGLPLRFSAPEGLLRSLEAITDAGGIAVVAFAKPPPTDTRVEVSVDAEALLGRDASLWPGVQGVIKLRPVGRDRVGVHIHELVSDAAAGTNQAAAALTRGLKSLGRGKVQVLGGELGAQLDAARGGNVAAAIRAVSDGAAGTADIIVFGQAQSDFVSRVGARSVWHEAIGTIRVYDAWNGAEIGKLERSTRASGIGDQDAAKKALEQLGALFAEGVHEILER